MDSVRSNQKVTFFFTTTARQNHSADSFFLTTDEIWGEHHRCSSLINEMQVQGHATACFRPRNSQLRTGFLIPISLPLQLPLFLASPGLGLGGREPGGKGTGSWCCSGHLALEPPGCGRYSNANSYSHWSSHGSSRSLTLEASIFRRTIPLPTGFQHLILGALFWDQFTIQASPSSWGEQSSFLLLALGLAHKKPTPFSIELQLSPTAAGYFLPLEVSLESWPSLSNSPKLQQMHVTPLIGSITSHIWLKMKDEHTLYTME